MSRVDRGRSYVCDESVLARAHSMHLDGMSVRQVARVFFDQCYSASPKALANAFLSAWRARGWEVRSQSSATALSNVHRAFRPQCSHVHRAGSQRGERCSRRCVGNDEWCWRHDPVRMAAALEALRGRV